MICILHSFRVQEALNDDFYKLADLLWSTVEEVANGTILATEVITTCFLAMREFRSMKISRQSRAALVEPANFCLTVYNLLDSLVR